MSSGDRFLNKTKTKSVTISKQNLVDIIAAWLYATRSVDEANNIKDITFYPDTHREDFLTLQVVYTEGGHKKESGT